MNATMKCPVCGGKLRSKNEVRRLASGIEYDCPRCGRFVLYDRIKDGFDDLGLQLRNRAILSHRLRLMQRPDGKAVEIFDFELPTFRLDDPLPSPAEQADSLILWLGDHQRSSAEAIDISESEVSGWIGAAITSNGRNEGLNWLLRQQQIDPLVEQSAVLEGPTHLRLTFEGWQRFESLKRAEIESHRAFMAMKFDEEMDHVVKDYFKPAVARTGFELRTLTDGQPAGLIDDQLRVALRTSRFVIADLTHANNGAYWEAGFAEGLGRPVIYTCREKEWREGKAHFDTNHLNTIIWGPGKLEDAATRLTTTIRATLPAEAKMTD